MMKPYHLLHTKTALMKPIVILTSMAALLLISAQQASGQANFIPKVGVNVSALDAEIRDFEAEARTGWNLGADLQIGDGFFFIQPGVHYYRFNAQLSSDPELPNALQLSEETTIQKIKVPIQAGLKITGDNGVIDIYGTAGLTPAFLLDVDEKPAFALQAEDLNSFTMNGSLGVGVELLFLSADVRYDIGISNFFENQDGKNNMLTGSIGFRF